MILALLLAFPIGTLIYGIGSMLVGIPTSFLLAWTPMKPRVLVGSLLSTICGVVIAEFAMKYMFVKLTGTFLWWQTIPWMIVPALNTIKKKKEVEAVASPQRFGPAAEMAESHSIGQSMTVLGIILGVLTSLYLLFWR
jgi:urea transporter